MSSTPKSMNMIQAINLALDHAMEQDPTVLVLGEDIADKQGGGVFKCTAGLSAKYGTERVKSTPIAEQAIMGAAVGAALGGMRPVAEIMLMNFMTVGMDQFVNHAAKLRFMSGGQTNVPIVIRTMTGTGFGSGGQHCDYLEAWFAHTAGMKVVAPSNPADAYGLMRAAIDDPDPVLIIENLPIYWVPGEPAETGHVVPLGKAKVVKEGTDVTIVSYSRIINEALAAVEEMEAAGVSAEIIDLRTISPWDKETVFASVAKTGRCLIAHEAVTQFGVGAEIAAVLQSQFFGKLKAPIARLGAPYAPVPFSKPLESAYPPSAKQIAEKAISLTK